MSSKLDQQLKNARERAEKAMEFAEKKHKHEVLKKAVELAHAGADAYEAERYGDAIKSFQNYLRVLESAKKVKPHGLLPEHFDKKTEMMEMLLISGVYWDLSKIYDRTRKANMQRDFRIFISKYVQFSKGMPYQPLCAESLRKYIGNDKPLHRADFKSAYTAMTGEKKCFIAASLMDVTKPETREAFRRFRSGYLRHRGWGRVMIRWYYRQGPRLAGGTERMPEAARRALGRLLDRIARELLE